MASFGDLKTLVVNQLIGLEYTKSKTWYTGKSPFRDEKRPSFSFNSETGYGYDHTIKQSYNLQEMCSVLGIDMRGGISAYQPPKKIELTVPSSKDYSGVKVDHRFLEHCFFTGKNKAFAYFGQYGIDEQTCTENMLGYCQWESKKHNSTFAGWTIPYYHTQPNLCRLVAGCRIRADYSTASEKMPKYYGIGSSELAGPYTDDVVCSPDQKRIGRGLDALFIVEDEKSALCLRTLLRGHMISAIKWHSEERWDAVIKRVVANALKVIIIQDNDDNKPASNRDAGHTQALKLQSYLLPLSVSIIKPPVNDIADLYKEWGKEKAFDWLRSQPACRNLF